MSVQGRSRLPALSNGWEWSYLRVRVIISKQKANQFESLVGQHGELWIMVGKKQADEGVHTDGST